MVSCGRVSLAVPSEASRQVRSEFVLGGRKGGQDNTFGEFVSLSGIYRIPRLVMRGEVPETNPWKVGPRWWCSCLAHASFICQVLVRHHCGGCWAAHCLGR